MNVLAPVVALLLSTLFEGYRWDLAAGPARSWCSSAPRSPSAAGRPP
ncbi:hypothetical protein [Hankyongella ginsenosidimutans]|nr:hypothetical protein [Hankyongella ginsenosidimutans]